MGKPAETPKLTAQAWLDYTLDDLRQNLKKLKIQDTDTLFNSVHGQLVAAAGDDVEKLTIAYALYGKYVDMGVGRGMGAGVRRSNDGYSKIRDDRGQLHTYARKKRPWVSKEIGKQVFRLNLLMAELLGNRAVAIFQEGLPGAIEINL